MFYILHNHIISGVFSFLTGNRVIWMKLSLLAFTESVCVEEIPCHVCILLRQKDRRSLDHLLLLLHNNSYKRACWCQTSIFQNTLLFTFHQQLPFSMQSALQGNNNLGSFIKASMIQDSRPLNLLRYINPCVKNEKTRLNFFEAVTIPCEAILITML